MAKRPADAGAASPRRGEPPEWVIWWSNPSKPSAPSLDLFTPVVDSRSAYFNKPTGGLWTSSEDTEWGWEDWCRREEMDWLGERWRLHVAGGPRVLRIDSAVDLYAVHERFPRIETRHGYTDHGIDWVGLGREYDAVWLTADGHFATRLTRVSDPLSLGTYAWDCDTILWYRWSFDRVEGAAQPLTAPQRGATTTLKSNND